MSVGDRATQQPRMGGRWDRENVACRGVSGGGCGAVFAGARRVVATQWSVADDATAALMTTFYGRLAEGASPAEALRAAQLGHIGGGRTISHPFYWAPFEVIGGW